MTLTFGCSNSSGEKIQSNLTRLVVIIWLFVVLVSTSSYTASLTSMLTVQRLQPNITDINFLLRTRSMVGCDGDSFIRKYLVNVLKFDPNKIKDIGSQDEYPGKFKSGEIAAAFLELPYEKVFMNQFCKKYTATIAANRFGGLGFVFQKGSPIAKDFSEAILILSENGKLQELSDKWFLWPKACSSDTTAETDSLSLTSFVGLYIVSVTTSTLCCVVFLVLVQLFKTYRQHEQRNGGTSTTNDESVWNRTVKVFRYFDKGGLNIPGRVYSASSSSASVDDDWTSPVFEQGSTSFNSTPACTSSSFERSTAGEIEIVGTSVRYESSSPPAQIEAQ